MALALRTLASASARATERCRDVGAAFGRLYVNAYIETLVLKNCLEATLPELEIRLRLAFKHGQKIFDVGHGGYDWTRKLSNLDRYLTKFAQIWQ
jgi:hypothetical protein